MTTTENSRADALTDAVWRLKRDLERGDMGAGTCLVYMADLRTLLAASPVEQPAEAPIDDARECLMDVVSHHDNIVAGFAAQRLAAEEAQDHDTAAYWKREIDVAHRMKVQAERALVAMAQPVAAPIHPDVLAHIKWLHYCLREEGHCIDGGKCHHECGPKGECWRQDGCVPLTGSRLTDGWKLRAPSAPSPADERAAWDNARDSLAVAMAGFAARSGNRDFNAAITVLDAITEPGLPLSWLRTDRAASANETGAEACKTCGGSRVVDDGEITGSGGVEFENGPIKCVKDCPDCAAPQPAQADARPTDDELWDQTLRERDEYHETADKLAAAIAKYFGVDIGEHSNANCPWDEALEVIENAAQADARVGLTDEQILNAFRDAGIDLNATPNMAYTVRGQQAQLVNAVRALLQGANHGR